MPLADILQQFAPQASVAEASFRALVSSLVDAAPCAADVGGLDAAQVALFRRCFERFGVSKCEMQRFAVAVAPGASSDSEIGSVLRFASTFYVFLRCERKRPFVDARAAWTTLRSLRPFSTQLSSEGLRYVVRALVDDRLFSVGQVAKAAGAHQQGNPAAIDSNFDKWVRHEAEKPWHNVSVQRWLASSMESAPIASEPAGSERLECAAAAQRAIVRMHAAIVEHFVTAYAETDWRAMSEDAIANKLDEIMREESTETGLESSSSSSDNDVDNLTSGIERLTVRPNQNNTCHACGCRGVVVFRGDLFRWTCSNLTCGTRFADWRPVSRKRD